MTDNRGISTPRAPHWRSRAACRGLNTEDFFPRGTTGVFVLHIEEAKKVCRACPVAMACAMDAITERVEHGVWGALDEVQRRRILRQASASDRTGPVLARLIEREWAKNPLAEAYLKRTQQDEDGHVRWTVQSSTVTVVGRVFTPRQLAFEFGHHRAAEGPVWTTCGVAGCVAVEHLADGQMRWQRDHTKAS